MALLKRSCLINILEFLDCVMNYVDEGYPLDVDVVYLDFEKAFDKIPCRKLMLKFRAMGISAKVSDWIKDWLMDREQRVVLLGSCSIWIRVKN